jgi:hypothetical protein
MAGVKRMVCIPVDDLLRMLGDYAGETAIPFDSKPHRVRVDPCFRLMGMEIDSPSVPTHDRILLDFQIKRFSPASGPASTVLVTT